MLYIPGIWYHLHVSASFVVVRLKSQVGDPGCASMKHYRYNEYALWRTRLKGEKHLNNLAYLALIVRADTEIKTHA